MSKPDLSYAYILNQELVRLIGFGYLKDLHFDQKKPFVDVHLIAKKLNIPAPTTSNNDLIQIFQRAETVAFNIILKSSRRLSTNDYTNDDLINMRNMLVVPLKLIDHYMYLFLADHYITESQLIHNDYNLKSQFIDELSHDLNVSYYIVKERVNTHFENLKERSVEI